MSRIEKDDYVYLTADIGCLLKDNRYNLVSKKAVCKIENEHYFTEIGEDYQ